MTQKELSGRADPVRDIQQWLNYVTYKPGWRFQYSKLRNNREYIIVWATGPDVCNPGGTFTTGPLFEVSPDITTRAQLLDYVMDVCIPGVEQHERWEWFRVDGKHWRDPHAPGMPAFTTDFAGYT